jgi:GNAT superfamily N-acetyltransferase
VLIRAAESADAPVILELIQELAEYEKAPTEVIATVADLEATLFCENPAVFCHLIEEDSDDGGERGSAERGVERGGGRSRDGQVVGMAIWFLNYSTWHGQHGIYLEDLFVREQYRGRGYGIAMLKFLAALCIERGYTRFQWWVLDWNTPAIEFYKSQGAVPMSEWTVFRVTGEPLRHLAN